MKTALVRFSILAALLLTAQVATAGNVRRALQMVPSDSQLVIAVDVDRVRSSKLFALAIGKLEQQGGQAYKDLVKSAGFDVRKDLRTAVVSMSGKNDQVVVILGGAFSAARLKATAMADKTAKISFYRGVRLMGRSDATLALIAGHLVAGPRTMVEKAVDAVNGKQAPRALKALIRKQPRTAGLVFAIPASGAFGADLRNNPGFQNLTAMHGWIRLAGGSMAVKGSVGMDFKSAADAGAQKTALTTAVGQLAQMSTGSGVDLSKGITVTQSGTTARLNGDFASAQVKQVLGLIGAL